MPSRKSAARLRTQLWEEAQAKPKQGTVATARKSPCVGRNPGEIEQSAGTWPLAAGTLLSLEKTGVRIPSLKRPLSAKSGHSTQRFQFPLSKWSAYQNIKIADANRTVECTQNCIGLVARRVAKRGSWVKGMTPERKPRTRTNSNHIPIRTEISAPTTSVSSSWGDSVTNVRFGSEADTQARRLLSARSGSRRGQILAKASPRQNRTTGLSVPPGGWRHPRVRPSSLPQKPGPVARATR